MTARTKTMFIACAVLLLGGLAPSSWAGTGTSNACNDRTTTGGTEVPLVTTGITLAVEAGGSPPYLQVCYSTSPPGHPGTSVTGGWVDIRLLNSPPYMTCTRDTNPTLLGVDCVLRDDNPSSPGYTLDVTLYFQDAPVRLVSGVEVGTLAEPTCLKGTTIYAGVTTIPITSIGVCTR